MDKGIIGTAQNGKHYIEMDSDDALALASGDRIRAFSNAITEGRGKNRRRVGSLVHFLTVSGIGKEYEIPDYEAPKENLDGHKYVRRVYGTLDTEKHYD